VIHKPVAHTSKWPTPPNTRRVIQRPPKWQHHNSKRPFFERAESELGVQGYKLGQITSLRGVERAYNVSRKTVKRRVSGITPQRGSAAPNRRLTPIQEESLKQWILSIDQCGMPPRIATVRQMASILAGWGGPLACMGH
jgi:hypothetical protein